MSTQKRYQEWRIASLKDPARAATYLNEALLLGDTEMFLHAIRDVIVARSEDIQNIIERIGLGDKSHSWIMSRERTPELEGIDVLLDALGFRLVIEVKKDPSEICH